MQINLHRVVKMTFYTMAFLKEAERGWGECRGDYAVRKIKSVAETINRRETERIRVTPFKPKRKNLSQKKTEVIDTDSKSACGTSLTPQKQYH